MVGVVVFQKHATIQQSPLKKKGRGSGQMTLNQNERQREKGAGGLT